MGTTKFDNGNPVVDEHSIKGGAQILLSLHPLKWIDADFYHMRTTLAGICAWVRDRGRGVSFCG